LPKILQQNGYRTGLIGKWHLGGPYEEVMAPNKHPLDQGFDYFFGYDRAEITYYDSDLLWRNRQSGVEAKGYLTEQITTEAIDFIDRNKDSDNPFFLYLSHHAPHEPVVAPPKQYLEPFDIDGGFMDNVYATIYAMDKGISDVMSHLKKSGLDENTLVIFASDNGTPGTYPWPANGPLRGFKRNYYEGGMRVPMIIRWPGKVPAGKDCTDMISAMDIMPTIFEAAGLNVPQNLNLDGRSVLGVFKGQSHIPKDRTLFWAGPNGSVSFKLDNYIKKAKELGVSRWNLLPFGWYARKGKWKLIDPSDGTIELYDLQTDIGEHNNIAAKHPKIVEEILAEYRQWINQSSPPQIANVEGWKKLKARQYTIENSGKL
jgi:uncharacterized sulfatase